MNDLDFYEVLKQLWPTMLSAIKTPNDAMVIGNIGREIEYRFEQASKPVIQPKTDEQISDGSN